MQMSKIFPKSDKSDPISKQQYNGSFPLPHFSALAAPALLFWSGKVTTTPEVAGWMTEWLLLMVQNSG